MGNFNMESLRVPQDLEPATRPDFAFIRLGKPGPRTFIRTFLVPERTVRYWLVEAAGGEFYMATTDLALDLGSDAFPVCLERIQFTPVHILLRRNNFGIPWG